MLCSLCSSVIHYRLVLDPSLPVCCTSCAVKACVSCPPGAKRVPYKNSAGHHCITLLNSTTSRPAGKDTQADRAASGQKRYQTIEKTSHKLVRQGHYDSPKEVENAFGWPHGGSSSTASVHLAILNQPALLAVMQTGDAGGRERAFALLRLFFDQLVLPSETDTCGENPMAVKVTEKLVSAIQTGKHIVAFDIEKYRWNRYTGRHLISTDPLVIEPPPHNGLPPGLRLVYDASIGSFDPNTLVRHETYYSFRLPPAAVAEHEIFSGDEMQRLDAGMRAASDAGLDIYHCDGDEGSRLKAAGCEGLNLHRGTQKLLGIGYGGSVTRLPRGLDRFSIAENVVATLMLLPKLPEGKAVSLGMMKRVVGHTAERDAFHTMFQAHIPLLRAGMELEASRNEAKKQKR